MQEVIIYRSPAEAYLYNHPEIILVILVGAAATVLLYIGLSKVVDAVIRKTKWHRKAFHYQEKVSAVSLTLAAVIGYSFAYWVFL